LPPEAVRVLITALLIERAPAVVRSASFAREVHAWIMATETAFAEATPQPPNLRLAPNEIFRGTDEGSRERLSKTGPSTRSDSDAKSQSDRSAKPSSGKKSDSGRTTDQSLSPTTRAHSPVVRRAAPPQE